MNGTQSAHPNNEPTPSSERVELGAWSSKALAGLLPEHAELVDAIAQRVVELLDKRDVPPPADRLLSPRELAAELRVSPAFVYEHQQELGVMRLGTGSKPRLRFDLEKAKAAMARSTGGRPQPADVSGDGASSVAGPRRSRRLPNGLPKPGTVLAVRGDRT